MPDVVTSDALESAATEDERPGRGIRLHPTGFGTAARFSARPPRRLTHPGSAPGASTRGQSLFDVLD